ncbi:stalk domain-containing protein [Desulforamulus ferrireducens]|uniref:Peptide-N(4)-(N-acetyl-beta-glucosaminyl)asparagine amidase n=1 Tax=Desulforamulus ferrireducens TaxID=1833852 RepID=A0A1S6J012_9FIRM|nr:stalk domain-containing protein [Desulforamulus ferrireducens]AQS60350.1 hypothetical protein B0537_15515 [Desulforamulus ferrireducens]
MRIIITSIIFALCFFFQQPIAKAETTKCVSFTIGNNEYKINNISYTMDTTPYISEGRVFVPLRILAYSLGVSENNVNWHPENQIININHENIQIEIKVGKKQISINGETRDIDVETEYSKKTGRVYLPARYIAEALGYKVHWHEDKIIISERVNSVSIEDVISINKFVNGLLKYGKGLGGQVPAKELISYGEGHCGDFCYLMMRELAKKGIEARIVGVTSTFKNANHSRVEVKIDGKWYTFDPTFNVYYNYSIQEMIDNPELSKTVVGNFDKSNSYMSPLFFKNASSILYYYDIDNRDHKIIGEGTEILSNVNYLTNYELDKAFDGDIKTYAVPNSYGFPQVIEIKFDKQQQFYRLKIFWESLENSGKNFSIEYYDQQQDKYKVLVERKNCSNFTSEHIFEYVSEKEIKTNMIKIVVHDTFGQPRFLIREVMLFE